VYSTARYQKCLASGHDTTLLKISSSATQGRTPVLLLLLLLLLLLFTAIEFSIGGNSPYTSNK